MVNSEKIKGRMKELSLTQVDIARRLNLSQPAVNQKINNIRPFDLSEAEKLADILKIPPDDFGLYFFNQ